MAGMFHQPGLPGHHVVAVTATGQTACGYFSMRERGRQLGILAVLLYGLSTGALATVLLIRMYGLLSCLCVALLSVHVEKWKDHGFDRKNKGLIAVTVLGFLTQYFSCFIVSFWQRLRQPDCCAVRERENCGSISVR